jgi:predicted ribosome quality control (RQC) complex YloA/Tae2 family protein
LREIGPRLEGARIDQVYGLPKNDLALVLGQPGTPRLWFCSEPEEPHLYERRGSHATPTRPPAFAMAARKLLRGRRIVAIEEVGDDRVVALRCSGSTGGSVVFEMIPRRATAMLVDSGGLVRAVWHRRRSRVRAGESYEPPAAPARDEPRELGREEWRKLESAPDERALSHALARSLHGVSLLVAREAAYRHARGEPLRKAVISEVERAQEEVTSARIYAPAALDDLTELPSRSQFLLAPYELGHTGDLVAIPFSSCRQAAAVFYPLRARLRILQRVRGELTSALELASARNARALDAVSRDRATLKDPERYRRWADLLLAHPGVAPEADASHVVVPDDYGDGEPLEIAIDRAKTLVENAQIYYRRAQRAERSVLRTRQRRQSLESRESRLAEMRTRVATVADLKAAHSLARLAGAEGAEIRTDRWQEPEATFPDSGPDTSVAVPEAADEAKATTPKRKPKAGISTYLSSDGCEILVGRNASANDRLTHRIAAPHDWWLHAEGPGSHVVVRNPTRQQDPPPDTLNEAASLAAYFSTARGATKVNVRFTQVRHLRRPRGSSPGRVILRLAQTVLAEPLSPKALFRESETRGTDNEPPTRSGPGAR